MFFIVVPHWSEFCFGVWPGLKHWRRLCYSLRVRTRTASLQCESAGESSGFPDESRPYYSLRTTAEKLLQQHWSYRRAGTKISVLMTCRPLTVHLCGFSPVCLRI